MKNMYSSVCLTRKCCEIAEFSNEEKRERIHEEMPLYPAKHSDIIPHSKLFLVGVSDFAKLFRNFNQMSAETRTSLVKANLRLLECLDGAYTTLKSFPESTAIMASYTTFLNENLIDQFFTECPEELAREERVRTLRQNIKAVKSQFRKVKPSIDEFIAIFGIALWNGCEFTWYTTNTVVVDSYASVAMLNLDTTSMNAENDRILRRKRTGILVELHTVYCRSGNTRYESRMT
ncbi:hypothetical protein PRIPAC_97560, partial [Pristionchus pacificus]|uniref:Nuclear receptor n=1 Tax=Pristionchus pacificus TaxID=54126 RepID=A0A2A6D217_PRIPA